MLQGIFMCILLNMNLTKQYVELREKAKQHLTNSADVLALRHIRVRINHCANLLSEVFRRELESSSGFLQENSWGARRAVSLLLHPGKAAKTCKLLLMNHSRILDHELRQIKMECASSNYIDNVSSTSFHTLQLSSIYHSGILNTLWC